VATRNGRFAAAACKLLEFGRHRPVDLNLLMTPDRYFFLIALAAAWIGGTAGAAASDDIESLDRIRETAVQSAGSQLGQENADTVVRVGQLDPRLRLPRCAAPLLAQSSPGARGAGSTTIVVRCDAGRPWSVLVPIRLSQERDVVMLARAIDANQPIPRDALALSRRDTATLEQGYFTAIDEVAGAIARRTFGAGTVLHPRLVQAPALVRRGDQVRIAADNTAIRVAATGTALRDGRAGERIPVRNLSSDRVVQGTVAAAGLVLVPLLVPSAP
jgi:flagella basal body P-ring formation protein FlgA